MANGAKVYLVDRELNEEKVVALNDLGRESGGSAHRY